MTQLSLLTADGSAPLPGPLGAIDPGQSVTQAAILVNAGATPITSILGSVIQDATLPASLAVTAAGITLTSTPTELLNAPLAPAASLPVTLTWSLTGTLTPQQKGSSDSATLTFEPL